MSTTLKSGLVAVAAAVAIMIVAFVVSVGTGDGTTSAGLDGVSIESPSSSAPTQTAPTARFSDLPTIFVDDLPMEAVTTLNLIHRGGPYPYRQDDGVFQNREGILPDRDRGHYREYTVETPDSDDRGARRIVAGAAGERFYTDDHYDSFCEILR